MKKTLTILGLMLSFCAACAYEIDANSIFRQGNSVGLKPNSRYTITCPSIIENVEEGEKGNVKFFFMDNEPFKVSDRAASTLVIRTYEPSNSYFKVFSGFKFTFSTSIFVGYNCSISTTSYTNFISISS